MNDSNSLQYLVSNIDIINKLKNFTVKIILYKDLQNISNITELLPMQYCAVCILIKTAINSGHWTSITRQNNILYYFDSYGVKLDGELKNIAPHLRYDLNENAKYLTKILKNTNFIVKQNTHKYQDYSESISTCGKWISIFIDYILSNKNHNLQKFQNEIQSLCDLYESNYGKTEHIEDHIANQIYNNL